MARIASASGNFDEAVKANETGDCIRAGPAESRFWKRMLKRLEAKDDINK